MYKYAPSKGAMYGPGQAQALGELLERIGFQSTPDQIVEASRPPHEPTHALFNWDDDAAAAAWRRQQARNHVNHLLIVIKTDGGKKSTKAFHSVVIKTGDNECQQGYCNMVNVAENPDLVEQVLAKALADLNGWRARYAEYRSVFAGVFRAIDEAREKVRRRRSRQKAGAA